MSISAPNPVTSCVDLIRTIGFGMAVAYRAKLADHSKCLRIVPFQKQGLGQGPTQISHRSATLTCALVAGGSERFLEFGPPFAISHIGHARCLFDFWLSQESYAGSENSAKSDILWGIIRSLDRGDFFE
jgi:hypothetical protein